jgi:hypothetical protein
MKLTKKHIGRLFDNNADGSWIYQLVDIKRGRLLFYSFDGSYIVETNKFADWKFFVPRKPWPQTWIKLGWEHPKFITK